MPLEVHPHSRFLASFVLLWLSAFLGVPNAVGQTVSGNSNLWPTYIDKQLGFRISYPNDWVLPPKRSANARFSANPPTGPGNCNVVAKPVNETLSMTQTELNAEVQALGIDAASWKSYVGSVGSNVRVISARHAAVNGIPAVIGVLDIDLENLQGKYVRRQMVAMTLTPGYIWTLNCGVSAARIPDVERSYTLLSQTFSKVFGSFGFSN